MTHVLIVEDHEENRNLLKLLLQANGYRVTVAGDGLEALAAARRDPLDAIISDALMPKMDGFALCRAWMQDAALRPIPFIFYSATYVHPDDAKFALALGAVRYLIKPLEAEVFLAELRAVLQQWAGHAAPAAVAPLDDIASHALHESALARKLEYKIAQLEAAKRKLQESEARFRSLTEMSSDFYWESDTGHRLTQRTSAAEKPSTVFKRSAQIGERRWDIPHLSPDAAGWAAHRAVLDAHQPFREFELSRLGTDGTEHFISVSGDPVFDTSGAFTGYRGVGTDITERKRASEALRESEARYRGLFGGIKSGVAVYTVWQNGEDFVFTDINAAGEQINKTSKQEVVGRRVSEVFPGVVELGLLDVFRRVWKTGQPERHPISFYHDNRITGWRDNYVYRLASGEVVAVHDDITERKQAELALHESTRRMEELSHRLLQVQEEERHRIARELHDRVGQTLAALGTHLELVRRELPAKSRERVQPHLAMARELIELTAAHMRELMTELRPPGLEEYGLLAALRVYVGTLVALGSAKIELRGTDFAPRPPRETEIALFRIAQEALANAALHAHAQRVEVSLEQNEQTVNMSIADDGVGFDSVRPAPHPSWGLAVMRERAEAVGASLRVNSAPGHGTRVSVEAPRPGGSGLALTQLPQRKT